MLHLLPSLGRSDVLRAHHRDHLTRVYPLGTRFDSSNMGEHGDGCFHAGVQMTCLNYQTFDAGQQLNRALFQLNGGRGYVLQEAVLAPPRRRRRRRSFSSSPSPRSTCPAAGEERPVADAGCLRPAAARRSGSRRRRRRPRASTSRRAWQGVGVDEVPPVHDDRRREQRAQPRGRARRGSRHLAAASSASRSTSRAVGDSSAPRRSRAALRRGYRSVQLRTRGACA